MHYVHKKARCDPEIAPSRTKTIHFFQVMRLNWQVKIELRRSQGPCSSILLLATVVSEKCQKETEKIIGCFVTFLSLVKFKLGGGGVPLGYAYAPIAENKKRVRKFSTRFLAFSNKISTVKKMVLSSSRGQGNFRKLEASRPRPRTSKCVLEDSTSATCKLLFESLM